MSNSSSRALSNQFLIRQVMTWRPSSFLALAWSPTGNRLAVGASDGCLWLFDPDTGAHRLFEGHTNWVRSVTWSPSGLILASGGDSTVRFWRLDTGEFSRVINGSAEINVVAWSPTGDWIAVGASNGGLCLFDANSDLHQAFENHASAVRTLAWAPEGNVLASGSADGSIHLLTPATGKVVKQTGSQMAGITSIAWSPDGQALAAASDDKTVRIWNPATGDMRQLLEGHTDLVRSVAWSPDGRAIASGSEDCSIRIWDSATGQPIHLVKGHLRGVASVRWSPDGHRLASASFDQTVCIWEHPYSGQPTKVLEGNTGWLRSISWSRDGKSVASGSDSGQIQIWDAVSGQPSFALDGHSTWVRGLAWSPNGDILASASDDGTIRLWNLDSRKVIHVLAGHRNWVRTVAWSPDGKLLASGSEDRTIHLWDMPSGAPRAILEGHGSAVQVIEWCPGGHLLASGSEDRTIRIWDMVNGRTIRILEGHTAPVRALAWSTDGSMLVSSADNCEGRIWLASDWQMVSTIERMPSRKWPLALFFDKNYPLPGKLGNAQIYWRDWKPEFNAGTELAPLTTAKVVLVGDSDVGKSSLALRLTEHRFAPRPTTFGMQVWVLPGEALHPPGVPLSNEQREVFLWDFGGQTEYQLVNQLFLHDTAVAIVMFDATRGDANYVAVDDWNLRLDQSCGANLKKILVGAKLDLAGGIVDFRRIQQLRERCGFLAFCQVSAKTGEGVEHLCEELSTSLAWDNLTKITRPPIYRRIREVIQSLHKRAPCVFYSDLEKLLSEEGLAFREEELETVVRQLALEGQIVDVRLTQGDRVLILRIDLISRYASSLILAARGNPRDVPLLEPQRILSPEMHLPGIPDSERLDRLTERVVLECVVQLLLERGICLEHSGILVFPTLFPQDVEADLDVLPHARPLYYDFDGPINNIYAALVARLAVSDEFGRVRLWGSRAEFEESGRGIFGIRRKDRSRGKGHIDLFFSPEVEPIRRDLFIRFVEDHLRTHGVSVLEGLAFECDCRYFRFDEELLRGRLENKMDEVQCPRCDKRYPLFRAAAKPRELASRLHALKTQVDFKSRLKVEKVKQEMIAGATWTSIELPIRILHLSDLHLMAHHSAESLLQPLAADMHEMGVQRLDYLVVSGDFADRCAPEGFVRAEHFLTVLMHRYALNPDRVVLVPGNHDVDWSRHVYKVDFDATNAASVDPDRCVRKDDVFFIRDDGEYPKRFERFRNFYKNIKQADYPEPHEFQGLLIPYPEAGIEFLTLNSAWEIDRFYPERASIHQEALSRALLKSEPKMPLRIVVWHHAVTGKNMIANPANVSRLIKAGYRLCLHGDVHEQVSSLLNHLDPSHSLHVIGCGSFSSSDSSLPHAVPRMYNLLEIERGFGRIHVYTRGQSDVGGPFEPYPLYGFQDDKGARRGDYWIDL